MPVFLEKCVLRLKNGCFLPEMLSQTPVFLRHASEILIKWAFVGSFVCVFNIVDVGECEDVLPGNFLEGIFGQYSQKSHKNEKTGCYARSTAFLSLFSAKYVYKIIIASPKLKKR